MNENISEYLNKYVINPDSQYAMMLKGKWGSEYLSLLENGLMNIRKELPMTKWCLNLIRFVIWTKRNFTDNECHRQSFAAYSSFKRS